MAKSPLPLLNDDPVRPKPNTARAASRPRSRASSGASVATTSMHEPSPGPSADPVLGKAADIARFSRLSSPDASTPQRIVCVANLHPRKRLGDLVLALKQTRTQVPDAELRLVGGGNDDEAMRLTALAAGLGLADCVSLAGGKADVAPEIADARVMALPSSCEGVPTALLEAMAAGRPVVATSVGHVSSIVDEGVEGFLIEPGDVASLADRLSRLLGDAGLAADMGRAARARAASHDVTTIAANLLTALKAAA